MNEQQISTKASLFSYITNIKTRKINMKCITCLIHNISEDGIMFQSEHQKWWIQNAKEHQFCENGMEIANRNHFRPTNTKNKVLAERMVFDNVHRKEIMWLFTNGWYRLPWKQTNTFLDGRGDKKEGHKDVKHQTQKILTVIRIKRITLTYIICRKI